MSRQGRVGSASRGRSAGILPYRLREGALEVLLVHPGGPFWRTKDLGAWSIAKGEHPPEEAAEDAARREFLEETGLPLEAPLLALGSVRQAGGKEVTGFAAALEIDPAAIRSNNFELEWPPRSGRMQSFPEIDRAAWFGLEEARAKINPGQRELLDRLAAAVAPGRGSPGG